MELEQFKQELKIDSNLNDDIKTYLIHENIKKFSKGNTDYKTNIFSNFKLNLKLLSSKEYIALYHEILLKAKNESELLALLSKLDEKISSRNDISTLRTNAINSIDASSSFYISLGNTDPSIKFINITLDNNALFYDWNYEYKELKDEKIINQFKDIILKYKNDLFEYSYNQENVEKKLLRNLVLKGKMRNSLQGNINSIKLSIYPELTIDEKLLNDSYFKFKNEVISFIEQNNSKAATINNKRA